MDTSVWSRAIRRDGSTHAPEVRVLAEALAGADAVYAPGPVLQELLQGLSGPRSAQAILQRFQVLPFITPDLQDHIAAAEVRSACRRSEVEIGTIDALLIQLCGRHDVTLLSIDQNFVFAVRHVPVELWRP